MLGTGTEQDPYVVFNESDFLNGVYTEGAHVRLADNIGNSAFKVSLIKCKSIDLSFNKLTVNCYDYFRVFNFQKNHYTTIKNGYIDIYGSFTVLMGRGVNLDKLKLTTFDFNQESFSLALGSTKGKTVVDFKKKIPTNNHDYDTNDGCYILTCNDSIKPELSTHTVFSYSELSNSIIIEHLGDPSFWLYNSNGIYLGEYFTHYFSGETLVNGLPAPYRKITAISSTLDMKLPFTAISDNLGKFNIEIRDYYHPIILIASDNVKGFLDKGLKYEEMTLYIPHGLQNGYAYFCTKGGQGGALPDPLPTEGTLITGDAEFSIRPLLPPVSYGPLMPAKKASDEPAI